MMNPVCCGVRAQAASSNRSALAGAIGRTAAAGTPCSTSMRSISGKVRRGRIAANRMLRLQVVARQQVQPLLDAAGRRARPCAAPGRGNRPAAAGGQPTRGHVRRHRAHRAGRHGYARPERDRRPRHGPASHRRRPTPPGNAASPPQTTLRRWPPPAPRPLQRCAPPIPSAPAVGNRRPWCAHAPPAPGTTIDQRLGTFDGTSRIVDAKPHLRGQRKSVAEPRGAPLPRYARAVPAHRAGRAATMAIHRRCRTAEVEVDARRRQCREPRGILPMQAGSEPSSCTRTGVPPTVRLPC